MLKKCIPLSIILLFSLNALKAQRIFENRNHSIYTYVFKLDSSQMRKAFSGVKIDSSLFLTHQVDSFHRDSVYQYKKLDYGFYFIVSVNNHLVTYQSYHNHPFIIQTWGTNKRNFMTLKNFENEIIRNAKISLMNDSICRYTPGMGAYLLPFSKTTKLFKIESNGYYDYININTQYASDAAIQNTKPNFNYTTIAPGYLVFNQPKFKHYDTLKWKAYLLYDDGSAYTEKLKVYLSIDYKEKFIGYIKPATPGAYFSQLEIADTFLVDKPYQLLLKNNLNQLVKSNTFSVENYELKAYQYNLFPPKQNSITGDAVGFTIAALDANKLPVLDATIAVNLRITNIQRYLKDRQYIPDAWMQSYYKIELPTDASGYTYIPLHDSLFSNFDASYELFISIKDLDNNVKEFRANFAYNNKQSTYDIYYEKDSLKVQYYRNTLPSKRTLILETIVNGKSTKKQITTPYTEPINFLANEYHLYWGDTALMAYQAPRDYASQVYFDGVRTGDSIHIDLINSLNLPIYYEVYYNTTKINEGYSTSFHMHEWAPGSISYHVVYGHNYLGGLVSSFKVKSFHLSEKKLNININQPADIYPGQTVDIAIKVTDHFNKPVNNVNLTAYSVNTQFGAIPEPDVPYLGLLRGGYPLNYCYPIAYVPNFASTFNLSKYHFDRLHLFKNEYYKLFYSKGGVCKINQRIKRKKSEFAVYVTRQHNLQNIVYLKVDNELVYHQFYQSPKSYSFPIANGKHRITIRTFDRLLTYNDLEVKDSFKYILGYNLDSIAFVQDTNLCLTGKLKTYERMEYFENALFLSIKTTIDTFTVYQNKQLKAFSTGYNYNYNNPLSMIRIDNDQYTSIGPVNQDQVRFKLYRQYEHEFNFEKGFAYLIYANEVKAIPIGQDIGQYGLLSNVIGNSLIYNFASFNKLWYSPEYDTLIISNHSIADPTSYKKQERERPSIAQKSYLPENSAQLASGKLIFVWPLTKGIYFNNAWLINRKNKKMSVINYQQRDLVQFFETGDYDLLLFTDSSYCLIDSLHIQTSGKTVFFVQPTYFKPLEYSIIYPYEKTIAELTKLPFYEFTDTPYTIKPFILEKKKIIGTKAKISGKVLDAKYNTPIEYAFIYAEIDGYFKAGATTNGDGAFELNQIPPGNYMLKIRTNDYRYQIIYNLKIEAGKELVIKINLLHMEDPVYYDEKGELMMAGKKDYLEYPEANYIGVDREGLSSNSTTTTVHQNSIVKTGQRSFNSAVGYSSGVSAEYSMVSGRGSRTDGTAYFVDGVRTNNWSFGDGVGQFKDRKMGESEFIDEAAMQNKLDAMASVAQANRVRDKFRDYGYWIPNLLTDKYGMAYCTVTFPDNITSWQTFVPAMNSKKQSGMKSMVTRSYKPLVAQMAVPFFLIEGDAILLKGKLINYTGSEKEVHIQFLINDSLIKRKDMRLDKLLLDSLYLTAAKGKDSISATFSMKLDNGYSDGEKRNVPIWPNSIVISNSQNIYLNKDTFIRIGIPKDVKSARILVHNSEVERLLNEIDVLKNYSYGCVEQTTSKLRALLAEKSIKQTLNLPFENDKMIRKMIHRLSTLRGPDGLWSWWGNGIDDNWLSAYVMRTLNEARLAGYGNNAYIKGANYMERMIPRQTIDEQLYTMNILKDMDREVDYDSILKHIDRTKLNVNSAMLYTRLLQKLGKPYQISDVTQHLQYNPGGGIFFGTRTYNYKNDLASTTLLAYDILSHNDTAKEYLPYIKQFFYSSGYPRHTFALAEMINAGANEAMKKSKSGNSITGDIVINGYRLTAKDFPFKNNLKPGDTLTIQHRGAAAYATLITSKAETEPQGNTNNFSIRSTLSGQTNDIKLKAGVPITMDITVEAFKSFENVMLEIPIPAGFSYYTKPASTGIETYREYFYNKTSIFCTQMKAGTYHFTIQLIPKFTGTLHLPPAKVELMYYPEIFNNEVPKTLIVE